MSDEQVREMLGPRMVSVAVTVETPSAWDEDAKPIRTTDAGWGDEDSNIIYVTFGTTNCVTAKRFSPTEFSFLELMKRRIERRIRALWP